MHVHNLAFQQGSIGRGSLLLKLHPTSSQYTFLNVCGTRWAYVKEFIKMWAGLGAWEVPGVVGFWRRVVPFQSNPNSGHSTLIWSPMDLTSSEHIDNQQCRAADVQTSYAGRDTTMQKGVQPQLKMANGSLGSHDPFRWAPCAVDNPK